MVHVCYHSGWLSVAHLKGINHRSEFFKADVSSDTILWLLLLNCWLSVTVSVLNVYQHQLIHVA